MYESAKLKIEKFIEIYQNEKLEILYYKDLQNLGCELNG